MNNLSYIFRFRKIKDKICVVNDFGFYVLLNKKEFNSFTKGKGGVNKNSILRDKNFFSNYLDMNWLIQIISERNFLNWKGPLTHIISITGKCNNECIYCSANSFNASSKIMNISTAKKIFDFIFSWS